MIQYCVVERGVQGPEWQKQKSYFVCNVEPRTTLCLGCHRVSIFAICNGDVVMDDTDLPKVSTRTSQQILKVFDLDRIKNQVIWQVVSIRAFSVLLEIGTLLSCQYASSEARFNLFSQVLIFWMFYTNTSAMSRSAAL